MAPVEEISESALKRIADVLGSNSAAARALKNAAERRARGEKIIFVRAAGAIFVVSDAPTPQQTDDETEGGTA